MVIARFLLRFLLIPLGFAAAALAVTLVAAAASWSRLMALVTADSDAGEAVMVLMAGAAMFVELGITAFAMMLPAIVAVAIAEIVAIRSWLYYAATGGLAAWLGWWTMEGIRKDDTVFNEPTLMAAAGIAGGLGYWLVAGWNAGFWKPVFERAAAPTVPPRAA